MAVSLLVVCLIARDVGHGGGHSRPAEFLATIPERYHSALISANVTIAVFAVNFSFLAYQFAPYRALHRRVSTTQVVAALGLLALAFVPLLAMSGFIDTILPADATPKVALLTIPLVAGGGVLLLRLPSREADPQGLLERHCSADAFAAFLTRGLREAAEQLRREKEQDMPDPEQGTPMHEVFSSSVLVGDDSRHDRQRTNGTWTDGAEFAAHIRHRRAVVESETIDVLDELVDGRRYADRHVIAVRERDGQSTVQEVYLFGELDEEGRFLRVEGTTLMLTGSESDRGLGSARSRVSSPPRYERREPSHASRWTIPLARSPAARSAA